MHSAAASVDVSTGLIEVERSENMIGDLRQVRSVSQLGVEGLKLPFVHAVGVATVPAEVVVPPHDLLFALAAGLGDDLQVPLRRSRCTLRITHSSALC